MNNDVSTTFDSLYQELCNYFFTKFLFREIDLLMVFGLFSILLRIKLQNLKTNHLKLFFRK